MEVVLRSHQPGDLGWVLSRHGALYTEEYGYNERFEGIVAEVVAKFLNERDPLRERCWIAERDGERLGSIFLMKETDKVAKLRLLLLEPSARGMGLGKLLVEACINGAKAAGYESIRLWTQSNLDAARSVYSKAGFVKVSEEEHTLFGRPSISETWELHLSDGQI
jgi:GNAT superfamily N-acetyltransferase